MAENKSNSTVYIGNLDERVSDRVLYDILIQAGRVVNLHIPHDKETGKPKGFAFAEYESEDIAEYAVKLFTGLVTLYKRTLKFGMSGQDKNTMISPTVNTSLRPRSYNNTDARFSDHKAPVPSNISMDQPNGYRSHNESADYNYSHRVFGSALDSVGRPRSGRHDSRNSADYH